MIMTAKQVLDIYWNNTAPVKPEKIAENVGIIIKYIQFRDNEFAGLIKKNTLQQIEIQVNRLYPEEKQRFIIAHELGHYFSVEDFKEFTDIDNLLEFELSKDRMSDFSYYREKIANTFAFELLMPKIAINYMLKTGQARNVGELAKIFKVSLSVMNVRLINLGYIEG